MLNKIKNWKFRTSTRYEFWKKMTIVKNHLKYGQKCSDFEWSSFQMVGTNLIGTIAIAKANPTLWKLMALPYNYQPLWTGFQVLVHFQTGYLVSIQNNGTLPSISMVYWAGSRIPFNGWLVFCSTLYWVKNLRDPRCEAAAWRPRCPSSRAACRFSSHNESSDCSTWKLTRLGY